MRSVPLPPSLDELRASRPKPKTKQVKFRVCLKTVTPVLGGASRPRVSDDIDPIRVPSLRGHLRFWWRALHGHEYAEPSQLFAAEQALWGGVHGETVTRSSVELTVNVTDKGWKNPEKIQMGDKDAYALWPAREERKKGTPPAIRREDVSFDLEVRCPPSRLVEVENVVRAWILFGGYGGRTRRGVGSVTVTREEEKWLPRESSEEALSHLFGRNIFASPGRVSTETPWLAGASLRAGAPRDAKSAWYRALEALKEFRQGTQSGARERSSDPSRPSISYWPEADKVRHLSTPKRGLPWAHRPRHHRAPAWPRAGFGLPIIGQFQSKSREEHSTRRTQNRPDKKCWNELAQNHPNYGTEPEGFELHWRSGNVEHDRLASPLILKALPLRGGKFAPCALWLNRSYPSGEVILKDVRGSEAPFDQLYAPRDDKVTFDALVGKTGLRQAFLDWLSSFYEGVQEVSP